MTDRWLNQNDPEALVAIAAADTLWGQVQQLRAIQLSLIVGLPVILALASQRWFSLALLSAYVGLAMLLLDVACVNWLIVERRREAAQAQNLFDIVSFSFARSKNRISKETDIARLAELAHSQSEVRAMRNKDWYTPALEHLPIAFGRLACMRESATWDATLRRRWSNLVMVMAAVSLTGFVTWAVFSHQPTDVFLQAIAVSLSPAIVWVIREVREQRDSASAVAAITFNLRNAWELAMNGTIVEPELSIAANEILSDFLEYRANTSPVPHAVYSLLRDRQSTDATETADLLLRDYERNFVSK